MADTFQLAGPRQRTEHLKLVFLPWVLAMSWLAGNAGAQLQAFPITDSAAVYELEGYSVLPPQGKNWFELRRDKQQALFGKKIESPTHSFVATATSDLISEK